MSPSSSQTLFEQIAHRNHEAVVFCSDAKTGLRAIIAVHDTTLGPALGGCRMKPYANEMDALADVLKLARAMTYKASMAGLDLGGGKSVVMIEKPEDKTPELMHAFAERINLLGGSYIGAGDVGSTTRDLKLIREVTPYVGGLDVPDGGLGDSSILTALGVFQGIRAAVQERFGGKDLNGIRVAIQGAGKVGFHLLEHLMKAGCTAVISDTNANALDHVRDVYPQVQVVSGEALFEADVDVFSPNAVGGLITADVARQLKARIVAGGANNPLDSEDTARILADRNILYAPDFVVNAGGIIMIKYEIDGRTFDEAREKTLGIYDTTMRVFTHARANNLLPWDAARELAEQRIQEARAKNAPGKNVSGRDTRPLAMR